MRIFILGSVPLILYCSVNTPKQKRIRMFEKYKETYPFPFCKNVSQYFNQPGDSAGCEALTSDFRPSQTPICNARMMNTCTMCHYSSHRNTVNGSLDNSIWNRHYLPFQYRLEKTVSCSLIFFPKFQQQFIDGNDIRAKGPVTFSDAFLKS